MMVMMHDQSDIIAPHRSYATSSPCYHVQLYLFNLGKVVAYSLENMAL